MLHHLGVAHPKGNLDSVTRSLISKRLASLSRNFTALPGSSTAADISSGEAGVSVFCSFQGTCLLKRRSVLCRKLSASVCVCVGVSVLVFAWVSARYPVAVLQCITLVPRVRSRRQAACCGSTVAFSETAVLCQSPSGCGTCGSAGIFSVCMFLGVACPLLPQSGVCSPACMNFSGSVLCAQCHPLFCDHPCSY